jgi:hypothetical protein
MRTIHLRQPRPGTWFVTVMLSASECHSHHGFPTRTQAHRAFEAEGRNQPFARMLVHLPGSIKAVVVRPALRMPRIGSDDVVREAIRQALGVSIWRDQQHPQVHEEAASGFSLRNSM